MYANLKNGNDFAIRNIKKLADELNKTSCNTVVMSAENFSWIFSGDHIVKLKLALAQYFDVNIILYIRRQEQLVISYVQQGSRRINPAFYFYSCGGEALPKYKSYYDDYLDFNKKTLLWESAFGKENITIRVMDKRLLYKSDAVLDFFNIIAPGLTIDSISENETVGFENNKVGYLISQSGVDKFFGNKIRLNLSNGKKALPSILDAQQFYARYVKSNIELNKRYHLSHSDNDIFNNDFSNYSENRTDLWDENSANQAIINVITSIDKIPVKAFLLFRLKIFIKQILRKSR